MRQQLVKCARCYRRRFVSRMRMRPGRIVDEGPIYVCTAKASCTVARKAYRRWLTSVTQ